MKAENGILRKQLESKTEGLLILSKEVVKLKHEINQLRATDCRQMEVGMKSKILILYFFFLRTLTLMMRLQLNFVTMAVVKDFQHHQRARGTGWSYTSN